LIQLIFSTINEDDRLDRLVAFSRRSYRGIVVASSRERGAGAEVVVPVRRNAIRTNRLEGDQLPLLMC
jgi:hypothetical protein